MGKLQHTYSMKGPQGPRSCLTHSKKSFNICMNKLKINMDQHKLTNIKNETSSRKSKDSNSKEVRK